MTLWGWRRTDKPGGVHWVNGTLETSYHRVARDGGTWILVASVPREAFKTVMASLERPNLEGEGK